jgi:hypothetical protein
LSWVFRIAKIDRLKKLLSKILGTIVSGFLGFVKHWFALFLKYVPPILFSSSSRYVSI